MNIKHAEHILAFDKQRFGNLKQGLNHMMIQEALAKMQGSLIIGRRKELEGDDRYGQLLPYIVFYQQDDENIVRFFTYQRGKGIGETRLLGNLSVGIGGHVDLSDVQQRLSVIDVLGTINNAMKREIDEEVKFTYNGDEAKPDLKPVFFGIINDLRDEVGAVHFGALYGIKLPEGIEVSCREPELTDIGMLSRKQLGACPQVTAAKFEGWSEIVIKEFAEFEELAKHV